MIITGLLVGVVLLLFFIPKKHIKKYAVIVSIIFSGLWFFFTPPNIYDLYRHYVALNTYQKLSLSDVISMSDFTWGNKLVNAYIRSYPVYSLYAYIISKIGIKELLVVVVTFLVYTLMFACVFSDEDFKERKWKYVFVFLIVLVSVNYQACSGIRNITAIYIFHYFLYQELVRKKKTIVCWCMYVFCCLIHSQAVVFLGIRIVLLLYNRITKNIIKLAMLFGVLLFTFYQDSFLDLISNIKFLSSIMGESVNLFEVYTENGTEYSSLVIRTYLVMYIFTLLIGYIIVKFYNTKGEWNQYYYYITLVVLFSLGTIQNTDIFLRFNFMIIPVTAVFCSVFIKQTGGNHIFSVKRRDNQLGANYQMIILLMVYMYMCVSLLINYYLRYRAMDQYYFIG